MSDKVRKHVYISGRVQGVGFRASTRRKAQSLGVTGWVRNLFDGRVEAVITGEEKNVEHMLNYLGEGPSFARVEDLEVHHEEYQGEFNTFSIKY